MQIFISLLFCLSCFSFGKIQEKAFEELRLLVKIKHEIMKKNKGGLSFVCKEKNFSTTFCDYRIFIRKKGEFINLCSLEGSFAPQTFPRYYLIERECSSWMAYFDRRDYFFF